MVKVRVSRVSIRVRLELGLGLWIGLGGNVREGNVGPFPRTIDPRIFPLLCSIRVRVRSGVSRVRVKFIV